MTKLDNLINPEVMADMIDGKIASKIVVTPFAKIDTELQGVPGDTITIPKYNYIGDASDVAEGEEATLATLTSTTVKYTVKKAVKAVQLTDEAVLSAYGNPVGQAETQIAQSLASKMDADGISALLTSTNTYADTGVISYNGIVKAIDVFNEEINTQKVMFVNPNQVTDLRLDPNFISADKYDNNVTMTGEIGKIANTLIVPSKKVVETAGKYKCPIVKLNDDTETEDDLSALTVFLKRDTMMETDRETLKGATTILANKHYIVALTNEGRVVVAEFLKATP